MLFPPIASKKLPNFITIHCSLFLTLGNKVGRIFDYKKSFVISLVVDRFSTVGLTTL